MAMPKVVPKTPRPAVILISGNMMIWNGTKAQMNMVKRSAFAHRTFQSAIA